MFLQGDTRHVELSDLERALWADVLLCAWMDESLWQLQAAGPHWQHPRLGPALLALRRLPHAFSLDA